MLYECGFFSRPEEVVRSPRAGAIARCESPEVEPRWKLNSGPLEKAVNVLNPLDYLSSLQSPSKATCLQMVLLSLLHGCAGRCTSYGYTSEPSLAPV